MELKDIEVKDPKHCTGTCEVCTCKKEMITFEASHYADAEKSIAALYIKGNKEGTAWNSKAWFPRSICTFSELRPYGRFNITAPKWFLEKLEILNKLTIVKNE